MKLLPILLALLIVTTLGCTPKPQDEQPQEPKAVLPGAPASAAAPVKAPIPSGAINYNIGDVEQGIRLQATVAGNSQTPNIEVKELKSPNDVIQLVTVNVSPPYPEHLWLKFFTKLERSGPNRPVALRGDIVLGENGETSLQKFTAVSFKLNPIPELQVDLMAKLQNVPESVLLSSRADALLLPVGTDPQSVDPATATAGPEDMTTIISNPVRVNFKAAPATP